MLCFICIRELSRNIFMVYGSTKEASNEIR